jgi:hypothetical protein
LKATMAPTTMSVQMAAATSDPVVPIPAIYARVARMVVPNPSSSYRRKEARSFNRSLPTPMGTSNAIQANTVARAVSAR